MRNWLSRRIPNLRLFCRMVTQTICLILLAVFIAAGCQKQQEEDLDTLSLAQQAEVISVPTDDAMRAIEATGGLDTWKNTTTLEFDCVVTFYQPDGSYYLTEQHYEVRPWLNSIKISAEEPQGKLIWKLSNGRFNILQGTAQIDAMSKQVPNCCFAEAILDIITAPVRFLDGSVEFSERSEPVRVQGKWYYLINRQEKVFTGRISEAVFYQDRDNSLVDMIRFACTCSGLALDRTVQYVRGYDYEEVGETGLLVPTRIEIFGTDARDRTRNRLVKIDVTAIEHTQQNINKVGP